ncbi:hypothetical protein HYY69_07680 [Candidatus Woesearchaeota archaeon]|nr:hypothetical protein [Candidatus Woesearchaeota archaeon]
MGWLLGEKEDKKLAQLAMMRNQIAASFTNLRKDIENQNKWISYLHQSHQTLAQAHKEITKTHTDLKISHEANKSKTNTHIAHMSKWIDFLHANNKALENRIKTLEENVSKAFLLYNKNIKDIYELIKNHPKVDEQKLREQLMNEVKLLLDAEKIREAKEKKKLLEQRAVRHEEHLSHEVPIQHMQRSQQPVQPIFQPLQPIPSVVSGYQSDLTSPEKKLLSFLFNQSEPMNYAQIAAKTGHSINTVRVNMNILKRKNLVEEHMLPSGIKLFTITNKERIKKVYNLQVL